MVERVDQFSYLQYSSEVKFSPAISYHGQKTYIELGYLLDCKSVNETPRIDTDLPPINVPERLLVPFCCGASFA